MDILITDELHIHYDPAGDKLFLEFIKNGIKEPMIISGNVTVIKRQDQSTAIIIFDRWSEKQAEFYELRRQLIKPDCSTCEHTYKRKECFTYD